MYHYFEDKDFLERARKVCVGILDNLELKLRSEGMNTQFFLVGSGARNMVTQNANGPIDFDYNLNVLSCDNFKDCKAIKEKVRKEFNKVMSEYKLTDVDDSTSSLTTKPIWFTDDPDTKFSIDLCIVKKDTVDQWNRLIHEKGNKSYYDNYYWNIAPNSKNYNEKASAIKKVSGAWLIFRQQYLDLKNKYLTQNDYDHPSFICYIEAINNVYNHLKQKKLI